MRVSGPRQLHVAVLVYISRNNRHVPFGFFGLGERGDVHCADVTVPCLCYSDVDYCECASLETYRRRIGRLTSHTSEPTMS